MIFSSLSVYYLPDVVKDTILKTYDIGRKWNENLPEIHIPKLTPYCVNGIKNTRRKMEDRHAAFPDLNSYLNLEVRVGRHNCNRISGHRTGTESTGLF